MHNFTKKTTLIFLAIFSTLFILQIQAQVSITNNNSDPHASAMLHVKSRDKGLLMPRMTTDERDAITNPATGLMIYNTDDNCFNYYTGTNWMKECGRSLTADTESTNGAAGGSTGFDEGHGIAVDSEGNVIIVGRIGATSTFGENTYENQGGQDAIVLKYSSTGDLLWSLHFASSDNENAYIVGVDANDNIYIGGSTDGNLTIGTETISETGDFFYIAKFDSDGNFLSLWYEANTSTYIEDMRVAADGSIHVVGGFDGTATFGSHTLTTSGFDVFVLKLDANYDVIWANQSNSSYTYPYGMDVDVNGNVHVTGEFEGTSTFGSTTISTTDGNYIAFWATYASDGSLVRVVQAEGTESYGYGIGSDASGNVYLTGEFSDDFTLDGVTISSPSLRNAYIAKYDLNGTLVWLKQIESSFFSFGWRIKVKASGEIVLMGGFRSDLTFDNTTYNISGSSQALLALAFDGDGNTSWIYYTDGNGSINTNDLAFDTDGKTYIVGNFSGTETIGGQTSTSLGSRDIYYTQLSNEGNPFEYANDVDSTQDGDTDSTNEIQDISFSGTSLSISDGSTVDLSSIDTDTNTDEQTLSFSNSNLTISNGNSVDLSSLDTDTDEQTLSFSDNQLSISNGNSVSLDNLTATTLEDADGDTKIEVEASSNENIIRFSNGGTEHFRMERGRFEMANIGNSIFIGSDAGLNDDWSNNRNVFIGQTAGTSNVSGTFNNALGIEAFYSSSSGDNNTAMGHRSLASVSGEPGNTAVGAYSMENSTSIAYNVAIGQSAMNNYDNGDNNVAIGYNTMIQGTSGDDNVAIGVEAGRDKTTGGGNVFIGARAGFSSQGDNNVFIGYEAGYNETASNRLYLDNSNTDSPLLYGEFDNNLLQINGTLNINNAFSLPTADGTENQILATDGNGAVEWTDLSTLDKDEQDLSLSGTTLSLTNDDTSVDLSGFSNTDEQNLTLTDDMLSIDNGNTVDLSTLSKTLLEDGDSDTNIQVEANSDEDHIRFRTNDIEALQVNANQQVGIGKTPTARLTVSTGAGGTAISSASNAGSFTIDNSTTRWQSYTATVDGQIDYIEISYNTGTGMPTMTVYKGAGTDGAVLGMITVDATGSGNHTVIFDLSSFHIDQVAGEQYTFELDEANRTKISINSNYDGGTLGNDPEWDLSFNVYVQEYLAGFQVGNEGVSINDYTLPSTDGTDGQILTTDGLGNVSWEDAPTALQNSNATLLQMQERLDQLEAENEVLKQQVLQIGELQNQLLQLQQQIQAQAVGLSNDNE